MNNTMNNQLSYEEFQAQVTKKVQKKLDERITVHVTDVTKNNGVILKGMTFTGQGESISPTIYLEQYYEAYKNGCSWGEIVDRIVDTFRMGAKNDIFDVEAFIDLSRATPHIAYKLVNYEKNKELLEQIPHKRFLDMAVVYYYLLNSGDFENATILIYNNHLKQWEISLEELDEIARQNTPVLLKEDLRTINEVLSELLIRKGASDLVEIPDEEEYDREFGMYVLSNETRIFGAATILYSGVLKEFADKKNTDLFILPSSIHEVILLPKREGVEWEKLQEMVKEVNSTQVEEVEILSDSVYCYMREKDTVLPAWEVA